MSRAEAFSIPFRWDRRPIVVQLVDVLGSHVFSESAGPPTVVQVVDVLAGHGSRLVMRILDRLVPLVEQRQTVEQRQQREAVDWEKLALVTPTPKRLELLALVLRGAYMSIAEHLDSEKAWEELGPEQRAPWVHLAAAGWSTTFRLAREAYQQQQNGKEESRARDIEASSSGAGEAAAG